MRIHLNTARLNGNRLRVTKEEKKDCNRATDPERNQIERRPVPVVQQRSESNKLEHNLEIGTVSIALDYLIKSSTTQGIQYERWRIQGEGIII